MCLEDCMRGTINMNKFTKVTEKEMLEISGGGPATVLGVIFLLGLVIGAVKGCSEGKKENDND